MNERLRVAILAPVWFQVPPPGYGGIEWIVALLADGLAELGHNVTLFASGDSHTKAQLSFVFEHAPSHLIGQSLVELEHSLACYERAGEFDIVNDHSGLLAATLSAGVSTPVLHTVHGPLDAEAGMVYEQIARFAPELGLISLSLNQRVPRPNLPWVATIPNALDLSLYPCKPHIGDYLLFIGRMSPDKGAHRAIAVAMETGLPLKLAGKKREAAERRYFDELVAPHLGRDIEYLGEVTHGQKVELLQDAMVTLFPIEWEEPFGLVMIEAMACGTPVIAFNRGSAPEIVEDGLTGFVVEDVNGAIGAVDRLGHLSREKVRRRFEERFTARRMAQDYLSAYRSLMTTAAPHLRLVTEDVPAH